MSQRGRAAIFHEVGRPFEIKEYPLPEPGPGAAVVKVETMLRRAKKTEYLNPLMSVLGRHFTEGDIKQLGQDLQVAHDIQMGLVPREYPELDGIDTGAKMVPARVVGGDFYDFILLEDGRIGFIIGDISGKGISAAMIMVMVRSVLRAFIMEGNSLRQSLLKLNDFLYQDTDAGRFLTLSYIILDPMGGDDMSYGRAGHHSPIKYNTGSKTHQLLHTQGMPLGLIKSGKSKSDYNVFEEKETKLDSGDIIVMFTDGVSEAMNENREMLGEENVIKMVSENSSLDPGEIAEIIYRKANEYAQGDPHDDITVMVVKKS